MRGLADADREDARSGSISASCSVSVAVSPSVTGGVNKSDTKADLALVIGVWGAPDPIGEGTAVVLWFAVKSGVRFAMAFF